MSDEEKLGGGKKSTSNFERESAAQNRPPLGVESSPARGASRGDEKKLTATDSAAVQTPELRSDPCLTSLAGETWRPDPQHLASIVALGFPEICAEKALFYTGNESADAAVGWILDNPAAQVDPTPLCFEGELSSSSTSVDSSPADNQMFKMAFAVDCSLKMGLGKVAAQVGHATLGLYTKLCSNPAHQISLAEWRQTGETKVVLRAQDADHLGALEKSAREMGLATYVVHDAGRTQIAAGSATVLSIFGETPKVDRVTGQMKLL